MTPEVTTEGTPEATSVVTPEVSSGPAGRRRLPAAERREQLVAATVHVVAAQGFAAATADAIVARAGVSKGLLWRYFDDLDHLMAQSAQLTLQRLAEVVGAGLDLSAPAPEVIRSAVRGAARLVQTHAAERRAMQEIVVGLRGPDGRQRLTLEDYEPLYAAQEAIFRRGQEDGDLRPGLDPRLLAVTYQGAVDAMLAYLEARPEVDPDEFAATVAEVLLAGMAAPG